MSGSDGRPSSSESGAAWASRDTASGTKFLINVCPPFYGNKVNACRILCWGILPIL